MLVNGAENASYLGLSAEAERAVVSVQVLTEEGEPLGACSGVLVSERWVLTAAHCARVGSSSAWVRFGNNADCPVAEVHAGRLVSHPSLDLLALELDQSTAELTVAVSALGALAQTDVRLTSGDLLTLAGYGLNQHGEYGARAFLVEPLAEQSDAALIVDGRGRTGACHGDSGGPLLARDPASGAPLVVGILSKGSPACRGRDEYIRLEGARGWLTDTLGLEATVGAVPCDHIAASGRCFGPVRAACIDSALAMDDCEHRGLVCGHDGERHACLPPALSTCGDVDQAGRCDENVAVWCEDGTLRTVACGERAKCLRDPGHGRVRCVDNDAPRALER